tara:strand:- start:542 stop:703 length:162 start_codon:yes stop_codon:yes gene_type:complete
MDLSLNNISQIPTEYLIIIKMDKPPIVEKVIGIEFVKKYMILAKKQNIGYPGK